MYILLQFFFYIFNIPVGFFLQKCNKKRTLYCLVYIFIHFYYFTQEYLISNIFLITKQLTQQTYIQINNRRNRNIYVKLGVWYGFCNFAKCQINKLNF